MRSCSWSLRTEALPRSLRAAGLLAALALLGPERAAAETCGEFTPPLFLKSACLKPGSVAGLFGTAVAVSGDPDQKYAVVGDPSGQGAAYVFVLTADSEGNLSKMLFSLPEPAGLPDDAAFGQSVAISMDGDLVAVGAPRAAVNGTSSGAVYLFQKQQGEQGEPSWALMEKQPLVGSDTNAFDLFGFAVALSDDGKTLLVGAPLHDAPNGLGNSGAAYVFHFDGGDWKQQHKLTAEDAEPDDQLGYSVAVAVPPDAAYASFLVGAPQTRPTTPNLGKVYLFENNVERSPPIQGVKPPEGAKVGDDLVAFGFSVSLRGDGNAALVGAPGARAKQGAAFLLTRSGGVWTTDEVSVPENVSGDAELGYSVAIDGPSIAVGARRDNALGAAFFFRFDSSPLHFDFLGKVDGNADTEGTELGSSVAVRGATFLVGTPPTIKQGKASQGTALVLTVTSDLEVTLAPLGGSVVPGQVDGYSRTFTVDNPSSTQVVGATVTVDFSQNVTSLFGFDREACYRASACFKKTVTKLDAGTTKIELRATVDPSATGRLTIIARLAAPPTVHDPNPDNQVPDSVTLVPVSSLSVAISVSPVPVVIPGALVTYTVMIGNRGPSTARNVALTDEFSNLSKLVAPSGVVTILKRTCTPPESSPPEIRFTCDPTRKTVTGILPGPRVAVFTVVGQVNAFLTGSLRYRATATVAGSPTVTKLKDSPLQPTANLMVALSALQNTAVPGSPLPMVYTLKVENLGPSNSPATPLSVLFPPELSAISWTCSSAKGATCKDDSGKGNIVETLDLPPGGMLTYTIQGVVASGVTRSFTITANLDVPTGVIDPDSPNSSTVTTKVQPTADLSIVVSNLPNVIPGSLLPQTFTVRVANAGPSDARRVKVTSTFASDLAAVTWTCAALNGSCTPSGVDNLNDVVSLRVGGVLTYRVRFVVGAGAVGTLVNKASVGAADSKPAFTDPRSGNDMGTGQIVLTPIADLRVRFDGGTAVPGSPLPATATLVVTNAGPNEVRTATVTTVLDPGVTSVTWRCVALNGSCGAGGTGNVNDSVSLRVQGTATYTFRFLVAPGAFPVLSNQATAKLKQDQTGITDPVSSNNTDIVGTTTLTPVADLAVTMDGSQNSDGSGVTYMIKVTNAGPSDVRKAVVSSTSGATVTWNCAALKGSCTSSQTSAVFSDQVSLRVGGTLTYTVTAGTSLTSYQASVACEPADCTDPRMGNNAASVTIGNP